jgi:hydroxymethylglutaryl-CoA lyase
MSDLPRAIEIQEEGPREGFQFEKTVFPTERKIQLIDALSETGLKEIQIASFVDPRRVPGWADAEAVVAGIRRKPGVRYTGLWLNEKGLERAIATGGLHLKGLLSSSASETFMQRNQNQDYAANERVLANNLARYKKHGITYVRAGIQAAFGCNYEGDVAPHKVVRVAEMLKRVTEEAGLEVSVLMLADTMAWANPLLIKRVVGAVRERWPALRISLHLHDTRGLAIANAMAGLEMGVDSFDASVAGLGGCPFAAHKGAAGNVCTEDLVLLARELGIETGIDLDRLIETARLAEEIFGHGLPGKVMHGGNLDAYRARAKERQAAE